VEEAAEVGDGEDEADKDSAVGITEALYTFEAPSMYYTLIVPSIAVCDGRGRTVLAI
jgi:hypothetical protein